MLSVVILLLSIASASFIYLAAQTCVVIRAEQLEHIKESGTLRDFVLRRFPLLFVHILFVLGCIACGVSDVISLRINTVTPLLLMTGIFIALSQGNKFRDRARMLMAGG